MLSGFGYGIYDLLGGRAYDNAISSWNNKDYFNATIWAINGVGQECLTLFTFGKWGATTKAGTIGIDVGGSVVPKGAVSAKGGASLYDDITAVGSRYINKATNITKTKFAENLSRNGWVKTASKDGKALLFEKDGAKYVIRDFAKSTGRPTADYYTKGSKSIDIKIRLGGN